LKKLKYEIIDKEIEKVRMRTMKIFHTADWHLGKLVQGVHMTEDQAYVLDELIEAIKQEKPDVLIIAGDLYDRAIPPPEAIQLLDDSLMKIVVDLKVPVLAIAGNHDSPNRLHFGSHMMKQSGYHIVGRSEEHTSELQSRFDLVCRLLLEKKKKYEI